MSLVPQLLTLAAADPVVQLAATPSVWSIEHLLTAAEAEDLIAAASHQRWDATPPSGSFKTRATRLLTAEHPALHGVLDAFSRLWDVDVRNSSFVPVVAYYPGAWGFEPHIDLFDLTGVVYLNTVAGGALSFPAAGLKLPPRVGSLVSWANRVPLANGTRAQDPLAAHSIERLSDIGFAVRYTLQIQVNRPPAAPRRATDRSLLFSAGGQLMDTATWTHLQLTSPGSHLGATVKAETKPDMDGTLAPNFLR